MGEEGRYSGVLRPNTRPDLHRRPLHSGTGKGKQSRRGVQKQHPHYLEKSNKSAPVAPPSRNAFAVRFSKIPPPQPKIEHWLPKVGKSDYRHHDNSRRSDTRSSRSEQHSGASATPSPFRRPPPSFDAWGVGGGGDGGGFDGGGGRLHATGWPLGINKGASTQGGLRGTGFTAAESGAASNETARARKEAELKQMLKLAPG